MASGKLLLRLIVQSGAWIIFMGVLLFWPAGDWLWPEAWAFLAIFSLCSILFCAWLWRSDRALLESRMGSLVQKGQSNWDKIFMSSIMVLWNLWLVFMAFDARRWQTSHVPVAVEVLGGLMILLGFALTVPVFRANSFAARRTGRARTATRGSSRRCRRRCTRLHTKRTPRADSPDT